MAKLVFVMALDHKRDKKNPVPVGQYSYRDNEGDWFLVRHGPTYNNVFRVVECSEKELDYLKIVEQHPKKSEEAK